MHHLKVCGYCHITFGTAEAQHEALDGKLVHRDCLHSANLEERERRSNRFSRLFGGGSSTQD